MTQIEPRATASPSFHTTRPSLVAGAGTRGLAADPDERPASIGAFGEALAEAHDPPRAGLEAQVGSGLRLTALTLTPLTVLELRDALRARIAAATARRVASGRARRGLRRR